MDRHFHIKLKSMRFLTLLNIMMLVFSFLPFWVKASESDVRNNPIDFHDYLDFDGTYDWDEAPYTLGSADDYYTYTHFRDVVCKTSTDLSVCETAMVGKKIRFETAEELYRFSVDVSFEQVYLSSDPAENVPVSSDKKDFLLGQHYVLGNDIDYSVLGAKTFIPIGYSFLDSTETQYEKTFQGIFDGQGFVISNMYFAGYDFLIYEELVDGELVDVAITPYYSMFTINNGTIKDIGLINPTFELLNLHITITRVSNLVGLNIGTVDHAFVIDNRDDIYNAGIRYNVGTSSSSFQAAGMIHENQGIFTNSYYASKVVVNASYINKFDAQPVLYLNTGGTIGNLVYDETRYLTSVGSFNLPIVNDYADGETTSILKSDASILNQPTNRWYFYPNDSYPRAQGLTYDEVHDRYLIQDAIDLAFFSRLIAYTTTTYDKAFNLHDYVLTDNIDMGVLGVNAYVTPSVTFFGSLSGLNPEGETLADNFYIYNLNMKRGTLRGTVYYAGLFSILGVNSHVHDINITQSSIQLTDTEANYGRLFNVGMLAGRLNAGTIEDVLLDVEIDLGTNALGETHVGALVGQAAGVIARVSSRGDMHANTHTFQPSYSIRPYYYIGGIVGSAALGAELNMRDVINYGDIYGFGTMSTFSFASGVSKIDIKIGGVIGYILNTASVSHHLVYATNMGDLILDDVIHAPSMPSSQNVGGVFGEAAGPAPILYDVVIIEEEEEEEEHEVLRFAYLYNEGNVIHEVMTGTSFVKAAGIGISNTTTATEYALLFNHGSFDYETFIYYPQGTDLFFSEYVEAGTSSSWGTTYRNKALELYNPTNSSINLSNYTIERYADGATSPTNTQTLSGTIAAGATFVIVNSTATSTLRSYADLQINRGVMDFDGNDALVLKKSGVIIDSIGQVGNNPGSGGWTGGGLSTTLRTLVRKPTVQFGRTSATSSFDPSDEWVGYASGTYTYLRSHSVTLFGDAPSSMRLFDYTTTIFDISASTPITLTRAYNYADLRYDSSYYHRVSPFYDSVNHNPTVIRYSANYGNIDYFNLDNDGTTMIPIELQTDTQISGITTVTNVDFLNVINHGDIKVVNVNLLTNTLSVSGFSYILSSGKYLKNSVNLGKITVASINSATTGNPNIYVGGLVNVNNSGDLHLETQNPNQPIATLGIINSLNYGEITSTYSATYHGILGRSNTYAAGIATLNAGSIQDSANLGAVRIYNSSSSGTTSLAGDGATANRITAFTHGVTAGGVTGITLSGNARVYDTANNGDVVAIAYRYARAGGIIATSLYSEAVAGGISISVFGLSDSIEQSVLLNGMNFGNISAVTFVIGSYSTSPYTSYNTSFRYGEGDAAGGTTGVSINPNTIVASNDRPGVYAAAGGVVGYGLSVMRNMLNHGTISGTDVAGGIVGATYVEGAQSPNTKTTVVDINTAINYGDIKAIATTSFGSISKTLLSYENISGFFKPDSQVYPTLHAADFPRDKRGFGGIFGRLQRGVRGIMSTEGGSFDFIVNANPNIDLVGRLDMDYSFTSSARYFQFYDAIYYSARLNDNTQAVFTGFYYGELLITGKSSNRAPYTYTATIVNVYTQIGTIPTLHSSPGTTGYQFVSTSDVSIGTTQLRYLPQYGNNGAIGVNWITEDPNDVLITNSSEQWMYDENFEMRTNPDLTEFIYYMDYDLLAERFKLGGANPRENGMYVLSTSAGSTFGAVLPSNMNLDVMRSMNESYPGEIPLGISYTPASPQYTAELDSAVVTQYNLLRQTIFNDKSELIPTIPSTLELTEVDGSHTVLSYPNVNYLTKTITYMISMEAFDESQEDVSFSVTNGFISAQALIAIRAQDYYGHAPSENELKAFRQLLKNEGAVNISSAYPADLTLSLPSKDIKYNEEVPLGYFTIYSEAFVGDDVFASPVYYTDYYISIIFTPTIVEAGGFTGLEAIAFNGGDLDDSFDPTDIRLDGTVNPTGSLRLVFTDENHVFTSGFDFKNNFTIKYNGTAVLPSFYTVTSVPATIDPETHVGTYEITFTFIGATRSGDYTLEYRYFPSSDLFTLIFDKAPSSAKAITTLNYYSMGTTLNITGLDISSQLNFGSRILIDNSPFAISDTTNYSLPLYRSRTTYNIGFLTPNSLQLSPFASVVSVELIDITYEDGYRTYEVAYEIMAEDESTTTYTHLISERSVDFTSVLKNGNETDPSDVFQEREVAETTFTIDLGFDQSLNLYTLTGSANYIYVDVTAVDYQSNPITLPQNLADWIVFDTDDYLDIIMTYAAIPGYYTFTFNYYRDSVNSVTMSTELVIKKLEGVDAYLKDIRFSQLLTETSYPSVDTSAVFVGSYVTGGVTYQYTMAFTNGNYAFRSTYEISGTPFDFNETGTYSLSGTSLTITPKDGTPITGGTIYANGTIQVSVKPSQSLSRVVNTLSAAHGLNRQVIDNNQYPLAYFAGIDYDGADMAGHPYFRVDGKVSNIPLVNYAPYMVDYLPNGATISRYAYDTQTGTWDWTNEVGEGATDEELAFLRTDFTIFPYTNTEPGDDDFVTVLYRVTSEDGSKFVYYYVSVTDVIFNATFVFDIYYCTGESQNTCTLASQSANFSNKMVIITVKNYLTNGENQNTSIQDPDQFPTFSEANLLSVMTQFFLTYSGNYYYSFSRNRSGFFAFDVELPVDQYLNQLYTYEIQFGEYDLNDASDYVSSMQGKYFYINFSTKNRTRRFNVYIRSIEVPSGRPWGLFDFFRSWGSD